ncbi:hypothetical protein [Nonomuraea sp. B1E8]
MSDTVALLRRELANTLALAHAFHVKEVSGEGFVGDLIVWGEN